MLPNLLVGVFRWDPVRKLRGPAFEVSTGHRRHELARRRLVRRERSLPVAARRGTPLYTLARFPVLPVGQVPELDRVRRIETFTLDYLPREQPLALNGGPTRGKGPEAVRHHVVGVGTDEEVGEELVVVNLPLLSVRKVRQPRGETLPRERHGLGVILELHGPAEPDPPRLVVLAALRRAYLAELGVDRRAVVALVVVLNQDLPVRRHLVAVPGDRHELTGAVVPDHLSQVAHMLLERRRVSARVREQPPLPLSDPDRYERVVGPIKSGYPAESRSPLQAPVQPVSPRVVRATDEPAARRLAHLGEQMPAVAAHVVEGPQVSFLIPREKHRLVASSHRATVTRAAQVLRTAYAYPTLVEEVLYLPLEHRIVGVSLGGKAHLPFRDHRRG